MFLMALNQSSTVKISGLYFEIFSALITILPVLWTNALDKCKDFIDDSTPRGSSPAQVDGLKAQVEE